MYSCRYCNKICKNLKSLVQHERLCTKNTERKHVWNEGLTKDTDLRLKERGEKLSKRLLNRELMPFFLGKHHSDDTKKHLSEVQKKFLKENPEKVPYKVNHYTKKSYPEKYFEDVFSKDEELKKLVGQYQVGLYSLDFAMPDIKFYIEIDGEQHYVDKRIVEHDKIRTKKLSELGWNVYRIRWSEYKKLKKEAKEKVIKKIKKLIK